MKKWLNKWLSVAGLMTFVFASMVESEAATYYVATSGNNANDGSQARPWRNIDYAADRVSPGDTVRVQPGTYAETVSSDTSGSAGNLITFVADGNVIVHAWTISGDYTRVIGFTMEGGNARNDGFYLFNVQYCEIWNNTIRNYNRDGIRTDNGTHTYQSHNCVFIGNVITNCYSKAFQIRGTNNLAEYNGFRFMKQDGFYLYGGWMVIRNNYSYDLIADAASHTDFLQTGSGSDIGLHDMLYEANLYIDEPGEHHHASNMNNNAGNNSNHISRRNVWHNIGSYGHGFAGDLYHHVKVYNEHCLESMGYHRTYTHGMGIAGDYTKTFNNIFYRWWGADVTTARVYSFAGVNNAGNYNLGFSPSRTMTFSGAFNSEPNTLKNVNPEFVDYANDNFYLRSTSRAIGAGGPLTSVTSASGSGTTFAVGDAGFFRGDMPALNQYNGELFVGDTITVGTDVLKVARISGNNITVTSSFSWASGDPVYWGDDTTPDLGAYPYLPGGFDYGVDIASHSNGQVVSGSQTILAVATNPQAVRRVIFFVNNIPVAVDNQSPFSFVWNTSGLANGSQHRIEARAYALYATKRLMETDAISLGVGTSSRPTPPTNLRVIDPE